MIDIGRHRENLGTLWCYIQSLWQIGVAIRKDTLGIQPVAQLPHTDYTSVKIVRLLSLSLIFIIFNSLLAVLLILGVLYSFIPEGLFKDIILVAADLTLVGGVWYAYYPLVSAVGSISKKYDYFWGSNSSEAMSIILRDQFEGYVTTFVNISIPVLAVHIATSGVTFLVQISLLLSVSTLLQDSSGVFLKLGIFIVIVVVCVCVCCLFAITSCCLFMVYYRIIGPKIRKEKKE